MTVFCLMENLGLIAEIKTPPRVHNMQLKLIPPHLSASFDAHLSAERIRGAREAFIVALVLFASAGILDIWMAPSVLFEIWALRAFIILLLSGLLWSTWFPFFIQRYVEMPMHK